MPRTSRQRDGRRPGTRRSTVLGLVAFAFCASAACALTQQLGSDRDISPTPPPDGAAAISATARPGPTPDASTSDGASRVLPSALRLAAGHRFNCGVTGTGGVKCWGDNRAGQLGCGGPCATFLYDSTPGDVVDSTSGVVAVAARRDHACALSSQGGLECWGDPATVMLTKSRVPVYVPGLTSGVVSFAVGDFHGCAALSDGRVVCWGDNSSEQAGASGAGSVDAPAVVDGISGALVVVAGGAHTCALTTSGGVRCWGDNRSEQLGQPGATLATSAAPLDVAGLTGGVVSLAAGTDFTCAIMSDRRVKCWGSNGSQKLGGAVAGATSAVASEVPNVLATSVSAAFDHACAVTTTGGVKCWGQAGNGKLGNGETRGSGSPADVIGFTSGAIAVAAGLSHTCAMTTAGVVRCWGLNYDGELGRDPDSVGFDGTPHDVVGF